MPARLELSRADLLQALKQVAVAAKFSKPRQIVFGFDETDLILDCGGATVRATASGEWPGEAVINCAHLLKFGNLFPAGDPILIRVENGRLCIQNWSIDCHWQTPELAILKLPLNASYVDFLRLGLCHTIDHIERSGLRQDYDAAVENRNRHIKVALEQLRELGVTRSDIESLVNQALVRSMK